MATAILEDSMVEALIVEKYNLSRPIKVKFLRRSFNDHYVISSGAAKYIVRVYLNQDRVDVGSRKFELDILDYLFENDFPVAYPIKDRNSNRLNEVCLNHEKRYMSLFSFAEGNSIEGINRELAFTFGTWIARLHMTSDDFKSDYHRCNLNVDHLVIQPIEEIERAAESLGIAHPSLFNGYVNDLIERFKIFPNDPGIFGFIHGDLNLSNIHYSKNTGFTFFDFDHCAFGWRIHDLAVVQLCYPKEIFEAVLKGYESVRRLQSIEIDSLKAYSDVLLIRKYKDILEMNPFENKIDEKKGIHKKCDFRH